MHSPAGAPAKVESRAAALDCAVVIATRNRPEAIGATLASLNKQGQIPSKVIVVDSSDDEATADVVAALKDSLRFEIEYRRTEIRSAARQRNLGAERAGAGIVLFLDDDVDLDPHCLQEMMTVFENDAEAAVGGVSATISNQVYSDPKGVNRLLLGIGLGSWKGPYAWLVGPAVNFLPEDTPGKVWETDWLPSTCTAYRADVFDKYRFAEFDGYSFAEDVDLSARVSKTHRLLNTTRARVFHQDMGKDTHKDWRALGRSMVVNRYGIMAGTMGRDGALDWFRLFWHEMVYCSVAWAAAGAGPARLRILSRLIAGKFSGFVCIWNGRRRKRR